MRVLPLCPIPSRALASLTLGFFFSLTVPGDLNAVFDWSCSADVVCLSVSHVAELLALRKAALSHSKQTKKRARDKDSAEDTTTDAAPSASGKRGRQKRQKPAVVVCATDDPAPPIPETSEPRPQSRHGLGAIAGGLFGSAGTSFYHPTVVPCFCAGHSYLLLSEVA